MNTYNPEYYRRNREKILAHARAYRKSHVSEIRKRSKNWYYKHRDEVLERAKLTCNTRKSMAKIKERVFDLLGRRCVRCGYSDIRALQIDHVDGGGRKMQKLRPSAYTRYKRILDEKGKGYQVLCANCNWIKRYENDELARKYPLKVTK